MKSLWIINLFIIIMSTVVSPEYVAAQSQKGKMYFSAEPFHSGHENSKNSFTSAEFIYGRIEADRPLKEAFNMPSIKTQPQYLSATYKITRDDNRDKFMQGKIFLRVDNGAENKSDFNFDITPAAAQAKSTVSVLDDFSSGFMAGFFLPYTDNSDYFWKNGEYKVELSIYLKSYDAWGRLEDSEKWPDITGMFTLKFDEKDIAAKIKNNEDGIAAMNTERMKLDALPEYFNKPAMVDDPNLAPAKVMAILKRDLPSVNIVKAVIPPFDGVLKDIAKNELGVILFRYVRPYVRVIYNENGKCFLGSVSLKEDYVGGGKYGPLKYHKFWGEEGLLDCSKIK